MLRRIIYSSQAAPGISIRDAYDIIRVSHNRNSKAGLTGGLILIDGYFFQLLEGLPSAVEERFGRIKADSRHRNLVVRRDDSERSPIFESEWMALRDGAAIDRELLRQHNYKVGMPAEEFSDDHLLSFMLACFESKVSCNA